MVSRVQNIRSTTKNTRPPVATRQPGEFFVNFADKQFGVIDTNQAPQDLIAIRFHSSLTDYAIGDHVIYQGKAYRAKQVIPAGNFNPAFWETAGMADAPADNKLYGRVNNAWDLVEIGDVLQLQATLDLKAPLASPALSGTPTAPTAAPTTNNAQLATTAFVKGQGYLVGGGAEITAKVNKTGDTMTGQLTLSGPPTVPLHAATKEYVDNKPSGANTVDTAPSSAVNGQLWWETDTGGLFVRYDDGSSQQWVQLNGEMGNAVQKTGDTMSGALRAPAFNLPLGGGLGQVDPGYVTIADANGNYAFTVGGAFAPENYYNNTAHIFRNRDASALFLHISAAKAHIPITTASVGSTTGALTVAGGVGVGGNMNVGGFIQTPSAIVGRNVQVRADSAADYPAFYWLNEAGANIAYCYLDRTIGSIMWSFPNMGSGSIKLHGYGIVMPSYGFGTKQGAANAALTTAFNFYWDGNFNAYIDATHIGIVTLTSDHRIKKDVQDLPSTWDVVKGLRPVSYTHTDYTPPGEEARAEERNGAPFVIGDDIERWGFVAHELQEDLLPSAASGTKDQPDAIQGLNLAPLVAALTKALQEAMTRIEALEGAAQAPAASSKKRS